MDLIKRIDDAIQKRIDSKQSRSYMGASGLGEPCDRKLWYSYKQPKSNHTPRTQRIFDLGNMLEDYLVRLIRDAGILIHTVDENNEQFGFEDGIIAGHIDGVLEDGAPVLIEFKSYNSTRFAALKKAGVKENDPTYFTQCQIYMGKMELESCVFMAICKNDCDLYTETIDFDPIEFNWALQRGKEIGAMEGLPERKYNHISHFKCKLCNWAKDCWKEN
jgi:hypothetical protein